MTQELTGSGSARVHDASRSQMGGGRLGGRLQRHRLGRDSKGGHRPGVGGFRSFGRRLR